MTTPEIAARIADIQAREAAKEDGYLVRIATTDPHATHLALAHFMRVFDQAGEAFGHFTCTEAEALAALWDTLAPGDGDWVREYHGAGGDDDCEDLHHDTWLENEGETRESHGCYTEEVR